ncbi:hypothetical protein [Kutzneria sp. CA-103260]|uniref:hypothetical protein n=1 Tax=Kutzneria sp. CA-103260 TaxID=2802641 RepID=UPI001BA47FCA|nr:hypothetical protein [Kutzneria sp. CA-103260]QUQ67123.1 hypothetical protein JJ691_48550 [Kutzneria sp. CA-103260]
MDIVVIGEAPVNERPKDERPAARPASDTQHKSLLGDIGPDDLRFRFVRTQESADGGRAARYPRHHHGFQQIRWTEFGAVNFAPGHDIAAGDLAYFPKGAYYGPQVKENGAQLLLQYGFGDDYPVGGKDWARKYREATERLRLKGEFKDGQYIDIDPETGERRVRDGVEALHDEHAGRKLVIPPEGYHAPVMMHTSNFAYYPVEPGVELKNLGSFFDYAGPNADTRISVVRLSGDGAFALTGERAQVAWSVGTGLRIASRTYPELTCLYSPREETVALGCGGDEPVEVFVVNLPRLD